MDGMTRRALCCGFVSLVGITSLVRAASARIDKAATSRTIRLACAQTGETFDDIYWNDGEYLPEAMARINWLLRDTHNDKAFDIDPALIDLLYAIADRGRTFRPFTIHSGYRSPKTNRLIRAEGYHAAPNSMHLFGKAVDIVLPGMSTTHLYRIARALKSGGVGFYPGESIIHVDTGPVRQWEIPKES